MAVKTYNEADKVQLSKNFNSYEFRCGLGSPCACTTVLIDDKLVEYLQKIRDHFGKSVTIIRESVAHLVLDTLKARPQILLFLVLLQEKQLNMLRVLVFLVLDYMRQVPMDILLILTLVIINHSGMVKMKLRELLLEVLPLLNQRNQKQMHLKLILLRQTLKRFGIISKLKV